ncbi:hypothetical protein CYMTET_17169 [Cymbomonas tetramitiformis]|uniref:Uncharacterized protein n=1 Tax=Cymbomonas tetramitiformis TaxID=36881 RepID=A0AAE0GB52_9CHLO|nr:hypothetical protein CYMTET_17169 [Cymbomonas tetramitiformis]
MSKIPINPLQWQLLITNAFAKSADSISIAPGASWAACGAAPALAPWAAEPAIELGAAAAGAALRLRRGPLRQPGAAAAGAASRLRRGPLRELGAAAAGPTRGAALGTLLGQLRARAVGCNSALLGQLHACAVGCCGGTAAGGCWVSEAASWGGSTAADCWVSKAVSCCGSTAAGCWVSKTVNRCWGNKRDDAGGWIIPWACTKCNCSNGRRAGQVTFAAMVAMHGGTPTLLGAVAVDVPAHGLFTPADST